MSEIQDIRKGNLFDIYSRLIRGDSLEPSEKMALLAVSIECSKQDDPIIRQLAYRISAAYGIKHKDFRPLLNIAAKEGYAPLVDGIIGRLTERERQQMGQFSIEILDATMELYERGGIVLSNDQWSLHQFFESHSKDDLIVVAPTSFGKSELIVEQCRRSRGQKICIIVPTKALVAQTRQRVLSASQQGDEAGEPWEPKIVTHPESTRAVLTDAVCIYTQERFFRHFIAYSHDIFDQILVDEAHNLFGKGSREILLAQILTLHQSRAQALNKNIVTKFFTPFLIDPNNLAFTYLGRPSDSKQINKNLKSEVFFVVDLKSSGEVQIYDQYFDRMIDDGVTDAQDVETYIAENAGRKNIIYQNRPVNIEKMARNLQAILPAIERSDQIEIITNALREYIHPQYLLASCLEKGLVYHHGSVPDVIKLYIENQFSAVSEIAFIICNSTLLEGVNIPATKLFLPTLGIGRGVLNASQFNNLIGRVCRYREIFKESDFDENLLMPEVHVVVNDEYMHSSVNPKNFLSDRIRVDKKKKDVNENPLIELDRSKISEARKADADILLDVIDPTIRIDQDISTAVTSAGYKSFTHNINELDILLHEREIQVEIDSIPAINDVDSFLQQVSEIFISRSHDNNDNYRIRRLLNKDVRDFYAMLLRWKIEHIPLPLAVRNMVSHWDEIGGLIFAGRWGDFQTVGDHYPQWINWDEKSESEKVNFAIVKLQDEYDFLENSVSKYAELFFDLDLLGEELYCNLRYGTSDDFEIELIKAGFNNSLAKHLLAEYSDFVSLIEEEGRHLDFDLDILSAMESNGENPISIFEVKLMAGL